MIAAKLDAAIKAVCPIHGVSIGRKDDKATWRIDFKDEATAQHRADAQAVVDAFDVQAALNPTKDELAAAASDSIDRLQFDVLFNQENRIRVLEGKAAISKAQYRDALIARWKVLNP